MIQSILIEIPFLPKMANGGHGSWRADYAEKLKMRKAVGRALWGQIPAAPWTHANAVFTRLSARQPDDDGLVHGFKAARDALKFYRVIIDDHPRCLSSTYLWEQAPPRKGMIRILVRPGLIIGPL